MPECGHDASTAVAALCNDCQTQRTTIRNRSAVRLSRPPAQRAGTITIQPRFTRQIIKASDALRAALTSGDPDGVTAAATALLARLRHPVEVAREELVEEDRPRQRRSRRA